jgi:hypothetical protein
MSTEDERLQQRLAQMSEAELVKWMATLEQMRLIDAAFARALHVVITPEVTDIMALLRQELRKRILTKGAP